MGLLVLKFFFHPNIRKRTLITSILCGLALFCNFFVLQIYCRPVNYAAAMCSAFFAAIVLMPFLHQKYIRSAAYLLIGSGIPICLYCIIFLADPYERFGGYLSQNILRIALFLSFRMALTAYAPLYLLWHIYCYVRLGTRAEKLLTLSGCAIPIIAFVFYLYPFCANYNLYMRAWNKYGNTQQFADALPRNYFTERFLGIGFLYHTKLNVIYDGWRPPLHDPFVNAALWIYSKGADGYYPPPFYWKTTIIPKEIYYHHLFPDLPLKANCPCNYTADGMSYFREQMDSLALSHASANYFRGR